MPGMGLLQRLPPLQTHPWAGRHRAVETAAAVEIEQGSLRRLLLDDFHKLFGKASAKNAPAFPQLPQRRRRRSITKRCGNRNPKNADTRFRLIPMLLKRHGVEKASGLGAGWTVRYRRWLEALTESEPLGRGGRQTLGSLLR